MGSYRNPYGYRCAVATREKTAMLSLRIIVLFTLHTLLTAIICCLQLNTGRGADANRRWIISHRCSQMAIYVFFCNARISFHTVYSNGLVQECLFFNFPSVICLPNMLSLWRDTTSELWTPVLFSL